MFAIVTREGSIAAVCSTAKKARSKAKRLISTRAIPECEVVDMRPPREVNEKARQFPAKRYVWGLARWGLHVIEGGTWVRERVRLVGYYSVRILRPLRA